MISILPITRIVGTVAVWYAACIAAVVALIWEFADHPSLLSSVGIAFSGATVLNALLVFVIYIGWKKICPRFRASTGSSFPI
jgi:hypothetical protein